MPLGKGNNGTIKTNMMNQGDNIRDDDLYRYADLIRPMNEHKTELKQSFLEESSMGVEDSCWLFEEENHHPTIDEAAQMAMISPNNGLEGPGVKSIFRRSATYEELDAVQAMLDSTIEEVLSETHSRTGQHEIDRCASLAMEEEDDDLGEELQHLEISQHSLWEDLNVSEFNLSIITSPPNDVATTLFLEDGETDEEISPVKNKDSTTDSSERSQTPEGETVLDRKIPNKPNGFNSNQRDLSTYARKTVQCQRKGVFPKIAKKKLAKAENVARSLNIEPLSLDVKSPNNADSDEEIENLGCWGRRFEIRRGWLKIPGRKKRNRNAQHPAERFGKGATQLMPSVQEEPIVDHKRQPIPLMHNIDQQEGVGNTLDSNCQQKVARGEACPHEDLAHRVTKNLLGIIKTCNRKNKKLKQQKKKLCKMLADAWHDKNYAQVIQQKQSMLFASTMQRKLEKANHQIRECQQENQRLKAQLQHFKKKEEEQVSSNIYFQTPKLKDEKSMLELQREIEIEMNAKYESKLRQEVESRMTKYVADEANLKRVVEGLQKTFERQRKVLERLLTTVKRCPVSCQQQQRQEEGNWPAATAVDITHAHQLGSFFSIPSISLLEQARRQEQTKRDQVVKESLHVAQVQQLQTQAGVDRPRNNGKIGTLRLLQDGSRMNQQSTPLKIFDESKMKKENDAIPKEQHSYLKQNTISSINRCFSCPAALDLKEIITIPRPSMTIVVPPSRVPIQIPREQMSEMTVQMAKRFIQYPIVLLFFASLTVHFCSLRFT